jgi:hypothetical protein
MNGTWLITSVFEKGTRNGCSSYGNISTGVTGLARDISGDLMRPRLEEVVEGNTGTYIQFYYI